MHQLDIRETITKIVDGIKFSWKNCDDTPIQKKTTRIVVKTIPSSFHLEPKR